MSETHSEDLEGMLLDIHEYNGYEIKVYTPSVHDCEKCPDCQAGHFITNCPLCHATDKPHNCPVCNIEHQWHQCPECKACHNHETGHVHEHEAGHNCALEHAEHNCSFCRQHPGEPHDCVICHEQSPCAKSHEMMATRLFINDVEAPFEIQPYVKAYNSIHFVPFRQYRNIVDLAKALIGLYPDLDFSHGGHGNGGHDHDEG
jgi:hypothetical protein